MDPRVKSLYIRVLRGRFDCNKIQRISGRYVNPYKDATTVCSYTLRRIYSNRKKSVKLRNIAKEIKYFEKYREWKQSLNNDHDVPEEVLSIMIDTTSRMPSCYKWARQFLVEKGDEDE